jgi:5-methylcytosine-specific restriction protein A
MGRPATSEPDNNTRNPPWNRDEPILALDAYVHWNGNPPTKTSTEIHELSQLMNGLQRALGTQRNPTLRNTNGVYMKLMNFRRLDPAFVSQGKSGLTRGNRLEEQVWNEFHGNPDHLSRVAAAIRESLREALGSGSNITQEDLLGDEEAVEGRLLTAQHQRRERSRKIVAAKKARVLRALGRLACEVCGFDFNQRYGGRGEGVIECHHTRPLEELGDGTPTRLSDLALLCANCHRVIHAQRPWLTVEELRASLRDVSA